MKRTPAIIISCCAIAIIVALAGCASGASSSAASATSASSAASTSESASGSASSTATSGESSAALTEAQVALEEGIAYWNGIEGREFDMGKARSAFLAAAEGGEPDGWYYLGMLRLHDIDPERWPQVMSYFDKAVETGSTHGLCGQALLYESGFGVAKDDAKAVELYQQAANEGDLYANVKLGERYAYGTGVEADPEKSMQLFEAAAESDEFMVKNAALAGIGSLYRDGLGVMSDTDKAIEYFKQASDNGYGEASKRLANMYMDGDMIDVDQAKAKEYYEKEAASGSRYNLAWFFTEVDPADYEQAAELCMQEVEGGKSRANSLCLLAYLTAMGQGVEKDEAAAIDYAHMALDAVSPLDSTADDMSVNPTLYASYILKALGAQ